MAKKNTHGGRRAGAGRPLGSGTGPGVDARVNRVAIMLSDDEAKQLRMVSKNRGFPPATVLHQLVTGPLKRAHTGLKRKR